MFLTKKPPGATAGGGGAKDDLHHKTEVAKTVSEENKQKWRGGPGGPKKEGMSGFQVVSMIFLPWIVMTLNVTLYTFCYHMYYQIVYLIIFCFIIIGVGLMTVGRIKQKPSYSNLGMLCLFATVIGVMLGLYSYYQWMNHYWRYQESRVYTDVTPIEKAAAHTDAGTVVFTEDSRVDTTKALGYKATKTYCVAPILDDSSVADVEFWAAGVDCCSQRADFNCDDAWDPNAKSGVVILDNGSFLPSNFDYYMKAVKQAEAAYGIVAAKQPLFVRWVTDPVKIEEEFYSWGFAFLMIASASYLGVCMVVGGVFYFANRPSRGKTGE